MATRTRHAEVAVHLARLIAVLAVIVVGVAVLLVPGSPAAAAANNSITGPVYLGVAPDGSQPLAGAGDVKVTYGYRAGTSGPFTYDDARAVLTSAGGTYTFTGLADGRYALRFEFVGTSEYTYTSVTSDYLGLGFGVSGGQTATVSGFVYRNVTIVGHVALGTADVSAGAGDVTVSVITGVLGAPPRATTTTDASGNYSVTVPQGDWHLIFDHTDPVRFPSYSPPAFPDVDSRTSGTAVRDVVVPGRSVISGVVKSTSGANLPGISVTARQYYPESDAYGGTTTTSTGSDGRYTLVVPIGPLYEVTFDDPGDVYASTGWDDISGYYLPDLIDVTGGTVDGVDAILNAGGVIQGTVTGPGLTSSGLPYVSLEVYVYDYESDGWVATGDVYHPNSSGYYRIPALYPDDYRLAVEYDGPNGYVGFLSGSLSVVAGGIRTFNPVLSAVHPPAGQLIKFPDSSTVYLTDGLGGLIVLPSFDLARDFGIPTGVRVVEHGTIGITSISGPLTSFVTCGTPFTIGHTRVGAGGAAVKISGSDVLGLPVTALSDPLCAALPDGGMALPLFVKSANDPTVWLIDGGRRERVPDQAVFSALQAPVVGYSNPVRTVSAAFLSGVPTGGVARPEGRLVKTTDSPTVYVVDDERLIPLASMGPIFDGGVPAGILNYAPGSFAGVDIASAPLAQVLRCSDLTYVAGSGRWTIVTDDAVDGLPFTQMTYGCMAWNRTWGTPAPALFVKSASSPTIYYVDGTTKHAVFSMTTVQRMSLPAAPTYVTVSDAFIASLATGAALLDPGMLVKGSGPSIYLVDGSGAALVPVPSFALLTDAGIPASYVTVPDAALAGIPVAAPLKNVITCLGGTWLAASGRLWPVQSSVVTGLPATALADSTCQQLPRSTAAAAAQVAVKGSDATISVLAGGTKRAALAIGTVQRATAPGFPLYLAVGDAFLASIPTGPALIDPSMLVKGTGATVYLADGSGPTLRPVPSAALLADYGLPLTFVAVSDATVSGLTSGSELTHVVTCLSATWVAASGTLWPVQSSVVSGLPSTALADATCLQLRRSSAAPAARLFLRQSNGTIFSLEGGQKLPVLTMATVQRLAPVGMPSYLGVADSFLASVPTGTAILEAGMLVKGAGATIYLVDGLGGKVPVPSFEAVADFGLSTAFVTVADATIAGLTTRASLSNFVDCGGSARLAGAGRLWAMTAGDRGSATPTSLSTALCGALPSGTFSLTSALLVKAPTAPTVYRIVNGQKTAIDAATFTALGGRYVVVNAGFLAGVPST